MRKASRDKVSCIHGETLVNDGGRGVWEDIAKRKKWMRKVKDGDDRPGGDLLLHAGRKVGNEEARERGMAAEIALIFWEAEQCVAGCPEGTKARCIGASPWLR